MSLLPWCRKCYRYLPSSAQSRCIRRYHSSRRWADILHNLQFLGLRDARRLAVDMVMRQVAGSRFVDAQAASASQMGWWEIETLSLPENRGALADLNGQWRDRFHDGNGLEHIVLSIDSWVSPTHREQKWSGKFAVERKAARAIWASIRYSTRISRTTCFLVAPSSMMRWPGREKSIFFRSIIRTSRLNTV